MTAPDVIARLRELLTKATPGPWEAGESTFGAAIGGHGITVASVSGRGRDRPAMADAALIVDAVNALPALLDERDRLLAVVEAARALDESLFAYRELCCMRSDDPKRWEKHDRLVRALDEQDERMHRLRQALAALTADEKETP